MAETILEPKISPLIVPEAPQEPVAVTSAVVSWTIFTSAVSVLPQASVTLTR
ncbi:hypothetical protein D9M72_377650 [compost metagenome]